MFHSAYRPLRRYSPRAAEDKCQTMTHTVIWIFSKYSRQSLEYIVQYLIIWRHKYFWRFLFFQEWMEVYNAHILNHVVLLLLFQSIGEFSPLSFLPWFLCNLHKWDLQFALPWPWYRNTGIHSACYFLWCLWCLILWVFLLPLHQ